MNVAALLNAKGDRVVTTGQDTAIRQVMRKMAEENVGAIVVTGLSGGQILGIISRRDIHRHLSRGGTEVLALKAAEVMSQSLRTCSLFDSVEQVLTLMLTTRTRHLPVIDYRGLCGLVSIADAVKCRLDAVEREVEALRNSRTAGPLAVMS